MSNITLSEIEQNPELRKNQENLKLILNTNPSDKWVKKHPFAKNVNYIPIERIEWLLDTLFIQWRVEVINYSQLFNSVSCHVRLHYLNPISGSWEFHDGLGAVGIQTDKGASAADLGAIKQDSVMKALPAAKSYAIKDATEHLGKIFGRDINRADQVVYKSTRKTPEEKLEEIQELYLEKSDKLTAKDLADLDRIINEKEVNSYDKVLRNLKKL
jgi:hypothetical protein